jgi:hypothetical protein
MTSDARNTEFFNFVPKVSVLWPSVGNLVLLFLLITVPDRRRRIVPEVVVVRHGQLGSGNLEGGGFG